LDGKIVRVTSNPIDADFLSLQIRRSLYIGARQDAVCEDVFESGDKHEVRSSLDVGADRPFAAAERNFRITAQHGSRNRGGRSDKDEIEIQVVFFEKPGFGRDPWHGLRKDSR
jgi:hypothetical protein